MNKSLSILVIALLFAHDVSAELQVDIGPTYIPRGDAQSARDITVNNGLFAVAFAVETAPPWGVARGGIVDIAVIHDGQVGYDIASLADFLPNTWTNWPTTYQRVEIVEQSEHQIILSIERDWNDVQLESTLTIKDNYGVIHIRTRMHNSGDTALEGIKSGYVVWPDGGSMFGVPGLYGKNAAKEDEALADWTAAYGEDWVIGLHAPFATQAEYDGQDRYTIHSLSAGQSRTFEAWLQIDNQGSLAPLVQQEITLARLGSGVLTGKVVRTDGKIVDQPAVVIYKDGHPYTWTIGAKGKYEIELPVGDYSVYATAQGHAQGMSKATSIGRGERHTLNFDDVAGPGMVHIQVSNAQDRQPVDARISIKSGPKPLIQYFGRSTLFTDLEKVGEITSIIAPGRYEFEVSAGGGFVSRPQVLKYDIGPGDTQEIDVKVAMLANPAAQGWYSADLHHHSDVLDGNTPAEFVAVSELAARLDILFLSDHDSVVNNASVGKLARERGALFMPGTEMSPSWAHFNAFPLDAGKQFEIDAGQSTVQEIFAEARRMGAELIEINHPWMGYGYFSSREKEAIPGGYDDSYQLVELEASFHNGGIERNQATVAEVWKMWNAGERKYFAAGSDVHDVWAEESGAARTYVYVFGELSVDAYVDGLKAGRSYASQGPLVDPEIMFGSEIEHEAGQLLDLHYSVQAVTGLVAVKLVSNGVVVALAEFAGTPAAIPVEFSVRPESDGWYSLVIEDTDGKFAYTNPIWVSVTD